MMQPFDFLCHMAEPILLLALSSYYIPITAFKLTINLQFSSLFSPSAFKDAWFANFWKVCGPRTTEVATPRVKPLVSLAHGIVLDIGPGTGEWLDLFDKSKVTKIYGVEPNRDHHPLLRQRIKDSSLSDIYVIVPVGVEDLDGKGLYGGEKMKGGWVRKGEADCVLTIQCLCSVPQPKEMIRGLYGYLKNGGEWIVYEHVIMKRGGLVRWYQSMVDIIWPHFLDGCSITRDTEKWLKEAGSWSKVDLKQPEDEPSYQMIPHIMGVLTK